MKNILTLFIALFSLVAVSAQTQGHNIVIDESSLTPVQTDALSGVAIDKIGKDTSQRPCARLKIHINRMTRAELDELSLHFPGGNIVEMKRAVNYEGNGLIVELTAKQATRFYLHHDKYGDSNEVSLNLEGDKEYKLSAQLNFTHSIVVSSNVVNAEVYLDGEYMGRTDDSFTLTVNDVTPGVHRVKVQSGVSVNEKEIEVSSASIHFRIEVNTTTSLPQYVVLKVVPNDAVVMVDGKNYVLDADGVVTLTLQNGSYNYEVLADEYYTERDTFVVRGEKVVKHIELKPAHGWLSVDADASLVDASVYVDNKLVGKTPISKCKLASGTHHIRIVKEMYHTHETTITIEEGKELNYTPTLSADFATVTIDAEEECDIYINNMYKGTSSWSGRLATGTYIFEARKKGCNSTFLTQSILSDPAQQRYKLAVPTPIMGMLNIVSTPAMAEVYVDGVHVGETPLMCPLIIGAHEVSVKKYGYSSYAQYIAIEDGKVFDVTAALDKNIESKKSTAKSGVANGHEWVDLGLSVKWATCNVGAYKLEQYGSHFAWGETESKSVYKESNSVTHGVRMDDIASNQQYDAATANWGDGWRIPTEAELNELKTKCIWQWKTINGINGYRIKGPNGNTIFLPAAGFKSGASSECVGRNGYYWSSASRSGNGSGAYYFYFDVKECEKYRGSRADGLSIRPVYTK